MNDKNNVQVFEFQNETTGIKYSIQKLNGLVILLGSQDEAIVFHQVYSGSEWEAIVTLANLAP